MMTSLQTGDAVCACTPQHTAPRTRSAITVVVVAVIVVIVVVVVVTSFIVSYKGEEGDFVFSLPELLGNFVSQSVVFADLDRDGYTDRVAIADEMTSIRWYRSVGGGAYEPFYRTIVSSSRSPIDAIVAVDLTSDQWPDILFVSSVDNKVGWFQNLRNEVFSLEKSVSVDALNVRTALAYDVDKDGDMDVLTANYFSNNVTIYFNDGEAAKFSFSEGLMVPATVEGLSALAGEKTMTTPTPVAQDLAEFEYFPADPYLTDEIRFLSPNATNQCAQTDQCECMPTPCECPPPPPCMEFQLLFSGNRRPLNNKLRRDVIKVYRNVPQAQCEFQCARRENCVMFYYYTNRKGVKICRLFNKEGGLQTGPFIGSVYLKDCPTTTTTTTTTTTLGAFYTVAEGLSQPANIKVGRDQLGRITNLEMDECERRCEVFTSCVMYYYTVNNRGLRVCRLFNNITSQRGSKLYGWTVYKNLDY